jgi:hypothetical protein
MQGELEEAGRYTAEAEGISSQTTSGNSNLLCLVQRADVAWERGEADRAVALWREILSTAPDIAALPSTQGMPTWIAALSGNPAAARPNLKRWAARGGMAGEEMDAEWLSVSWFWAESAIRANEPAAAESAYTSLSPYEDLFIIDGIAAHMLGSVAHMLGKLAAFLGRPGDAERHFERAIDAHARAGAVLWEARSRLQLARMLRDTDDPRDDRRRELASTALAAFEAAGSELEAADAAAVLGLDPTRAVAELDANVFRREGEYWTVAYEGALSRVKDSKGMRDINTLLSRPGKEIAALDLVGRDAGPGLARAEGLGSAGDAGEVLDERARAAYKARIADLQAEIDEAAADNDPARGARAREELETLADQLAGAYGLGGRARKAGDPAERARKAVTERIRDAIGRIAVGNEPLGRHLKASIRTGAFCCYSPEKPLTWSF